MPTRKRQGEIQTLQSEIAAEIESDGPEIAAMVFGSPDDQPDIVSVRNERLDDVYRQAYTRNDRTWLQGEAQRNPEQFLKVTERIGVTVPQVAPGAQSPVPPPGAFAHAAAAPPPQPALPVAPPAPVVAVPAPPVPVILGPNGQPLPPGGIVGV